MEEVLGAHTDPDRFNAFLRDWETVLAQRVDETASTFAHIPGIHGLILAGSVGRGEAWPLSDIDLLPIYDDNLTEEAQAEVECRPLEPLDRWVRERHERSWRARQHIGEDVTRAQDVRDVLRVCARYGIPEVVAAPFPLWLAVPADLGALDAKVANLSVLVRQCFAA